MLNKVFRNHLLSPAHVRVDRLKENRDSFVKVFRQHTPLSKKPFFFYLEMNIVKMLKQRILLIPHLCVKYIKNVKIQF